MKSDKIFYHMVLLASTSKLSMKEVPKHPLGIVPWSSVKTDVILKKTKKATMAKKLRT